MLWIHHQTLTTCTQREGNVHMNWTGGNKRREGQGSNLQKEMDYTKFSSSNTNTLALLSSLLFQSCLSFPTKACIHSSFSLVHVKKEKRENSSVKPLSFRLLWILNVLLVVYIQRTHIHTEREREATQHNPTSYYYTHFPHAIHKNGSWFIGSKNEKANPQNPVDTTATFVRDSPPTAPSSSIEVWEQPHLCVGSVVVNSHNKKWKIMSSITLPGHELWVESTHISVSHIHISKTWKKISCHLWQHEYIIALQEFKDKIFVTRILRK